MWSKLFSPSKVYLPSCSRPSPRSHCLNRETLHSSEGGGRCPSPNKEGGPCTPFKGSLSRGQETNVQTLCVGKRDGGLKSVVVDGTLFTGVERVPHVRGPEGWELDCGSFPRPPTSSGSRDEVRFILRGGRRSSTFTCKSVTTTPLRDSPVISCFQSEFGPTVSILPKVPLH